MTTQLKKTRLHELDRFTGNGGQCKLLSKLNNPKSRSAELDITFTLEDDGLKPV